MKWKKFKDEDEIQTSPLVQYRYKTITNFDLYRDFVIFNLNDMKVYYDMDIEEFYKKLESLLIKYEKEGKYLLVQPIDMKHVVLSKHEASKRTYWQFNAWHWICIDKLHKDDQYSYKRLNMKSIMDELHKEKESRATTTQEVRVIQTMPMNNFEPFSSIIYHD